MLTVKLSRICPFCGRILLDNRLIINDLAMAAGGENAAKLLNLTVPPPPQFLPPSFIVWHDLTSSSSDLPPVVGPLFMLVHKPFEGPSRAGATGRNRPRLVS